MKRLDIFDTDAQGGLSFSLKRLLEDLPAAVRNFERWCFVEIETVGKGALQFEGKVRSQPSGLCLSWEEAVHVAEAFKDILNLTFLVLDNISSECALKIEVIDSTLWSIDSDDLLILEWVKNSFAHVKTI